MYNYGLMKLYNILQLNTCDTHETIKAKYYTLLRKLTLKLRRTNNKVAYNDINNQMTELITIYTNYYTNVHLNIDVVEIKNYCYDEICMGNTCVCRCGGIYKCDILGIEECENCSCFILVTQNPQLLI